MNDYRLWIGGEWRKGEKSAEIRSPFDGETVARSDQADPAQMELALQAAAAAAKPLRKASRFARAQLLKMMGEGIAARRAEFVKCMALEAGKPLTMAEGEVTRALTTFQVASEEAKRLGGEVIPIDIDAGGRAYAPAVSYWVPRGPVLGITPFNFPLNLVAHKVAPALASGCPILIKPAPQAPGGAVLLAQVFEAAAKSVGAEIPLAALQVLSCANEVAGLAVADPRIATLSFTGSGKVGWVLQRAAVGKRVLLELGGNAAAIVHADGDLPRAAARCAAGGFSYAGQSCISVQRIFVQKAVAPRFQELLLAETRKHSHGDPLKSDVLCGPVIDSGAADRIMSWIEEAKAAGATVLIGGTRTGNVIAPTVISGAGPQLKISSEEVFAPVVLLYTYDRFEDALSAVNDSRYGLQAGVFTDSASLQRLAACELEVGGVIFNEVPTYRADQMPYGGVKESGLGREGLKYAMEEYSERRTVVNWIGTS